MKLSKQQKRIVSCSHGHSLVYAGAGCGKTHTLIAFIVSLINSGVPPQEILVLTYNKETEVDFRRRLNEALGCENSGVNVYTIHAFGLFVVNLFFKELGFTNKVRRTTKGQINSIINRVSKNSGITKKNLKRLYREYNGSKKNITFSVVEKEAIKEINKKYKTFKKNNDVIDYEDMIALPCNVFQKNDELLEQVASHFQYLLVDELQDIDRDQAKLIKILASGIGNSLMVGDKKQNIYGFRGATPENWEMLEKALKPVIYELTKSYRIKKKSLPFVNAVGGMICDDSSLVSDREGSSPSFHAFTNVDEQAEFLGNTIKKLIDRGVRSNDIVCLARRNESLRLLYLALTSRGIPCREQMSAEMEVQKGFKIIRCLLRVTRWQKQKHRAFPFNAAKHLVGVLKVDPIDSQRLLEEVSEEGWESFKVRRTSKCYLNVRAVQTAIIKAAECLDLEQVGQILIDVVKPFINSRFRNSKEQLYRELSSIKLTLRGCSWEDLRINDIEPVEAPEEAVLLSTCHAAKAKEWQYVFLTHVVEGELPYYTGLSDKNKNQQEEMRLFYVAVTRHSKKLCILQTPTSRHYFNENSKGNNNLKSESHFISEAKEHLKCFG